MGAVKTPELIEKVCAAFCSYYKPSRGHHLACRGLTELKGLLDGHPEVLDALALCRPDPFRDPYHHILHNLLCHTCSFVIDGCDFADPNYTKPALPCGGYRALSRLLETSGPVAEAVMRALLPRDSRLRLTPHCVLKHLERPCLYDIRNDELYELNSGAFAFLKDCVSGIPLENRWPEPDFLEICLKERLIQINARETSRTVQPRPSPIPSLRYLEFQLTTRCNLRCKHCYLESSSRIDIDLSRALDVLRQFEQMQGLRVLFSGGEPMTYPHLESLNRALGDYAFRTVLLTNGTLLKKNNYHLWHNFDEIQFSLDGLRNGHESLRGPGTFLQTLAGMETARRCGKDISVATMAHKKNLDEIRRLSRFIRAYPVLEWNIDVPVITGRLRHHPELWVSAEQAAPVMRFAFGGSYHASEEPFACGYHLCAVTAGGRVVRCGFFSDKTLGTVDDGLEKAWKRRDHIPLSKLFCAGCEHISTCKGGCRYRASHPLGKDPVMCAFFKYLEKHHENTDKD